MNKLYFILILLASKGYSQSIKLSDLDKIANQTLNQTQNLLANKNFKVNSKSSNSINMSKNYSFEEIDYEIGNEISYIFTDEAYLNTFLKDIYMSDYKVIKDGYGLKIFQKGNKKISIVRENTVVYVTYKK